MASNSILVALIVNCTLLIKYKEQVANLEANQILQSHSTGPECTGPR